MSIYVETAAEHLSKYGEELCGDCVEILRDEESTIIVLADGLGSGVKANILASLTSKIVATMMGGGATVSETVETVASTLPVCQERGIAYSTFTILRVYRDGQVRMVEFDNPEVVVLRRGKPVRIKKTASEYEGKRILESSFEAKPGDLLFLFSDGAVHAGIGQVLDLGWGHAGIVEYLRASCRPEQGARALARRLLAACDSLYMQKPGDDTTVVAVRLRPPMPACVMVGPPLSRADDARVVSRLMSCRGLKVVCGGITSQIVSRETGRELSVRFDYPNPAVPPTAAIEGIDLVTEGVLTLRKTLDYVEGYLKHGGGVEEVLLADRPDGASRLARMLLEQSTEVEFLVGRALNPAHQNPELPISLGIKLQLVEELAKCIRDMGKRVRVEYF